MCKIDGLDCPWCGANRWRLMDSRRLSAWFTCIECGAGSPPAEVYFSDSLDQWEEAAIEKAKEYREDSW